MTDPGDQKTVEARRIILRDESGRIRGRWSADFGQTSLELYGVDEKQRLSLTVEGSEHSNFSLSQIVFYGEGEKPTMYLEGSNDSGQLRLVDSDGRLRLGLKMQHFADQDWPQLILSGAGGWRMMLVVHDEIPHLILYDQEANPRIQMVVDKRGGRHVRRYWWKWFIPHWEWIGYHPREGTEG